MVAAAIFVAGCQSAAVPKSDPSCVSPDAAAGHFLALYGESASILQSFTGGRLTLFKERVRHPGVRLESDEIVAFGTDQKRLPVALFMFKDGCKVTSIVVRGSDYWRAKESIEREFS